MIDITEENIENLYKQVRNELGKYSKDLLKKDELIVFNKIDLIDKNKLKEKKDQFSKKTKNEVLAISTFDKNSVAKIKSKLIKYVSQKF
jgi:GTP-binding protein